MKGIPLALLFVFCLVLVGCGAESATLTVSQIPWPEDEQVGYVLQDLQGLELGSGQLTVRKEGDTYILSHELEYVAYVGQLVEVKDSMTMSVNARDLKPISEIHTQSTSGGVTPGQTTVITTIYSEGKVDVTVITDGEEQHKAELEIPEDSHDMDELFFLFRTIPFEVGYFATYTSVAPADGIITKATITVEGEEEVETPAGSFNCYKLLLFLVDLGEENYYWYGVAEPHYLVKFEGVGSVFLLSELP